MGGISAFTRTKLLELVKIIEFIKSNFFPLRSFDPTNSGRITENRFVKIMKSKENVAEEDITEMIAGSLVLKSLLKITNFAEYRSLHVKSKDEREDQEPYIIYKGRFPK